MADRDHSSLVAVVAEKELLLQDWGVVDDGFPGARYSRLSEDFWHWQKVEDVLEELCSVEDSLDRCGRVADRVGRHDEMWLY